MFTLNKKTFLISHFYPYQAQNYRESSSLYKCTIYYLMKIRTLCYMHTLLQLFYNQKQHFSPFSTKFKKYSTVGGIYECHYNTVLS